MSQWALLLGMLSGAFGCLFLFLARLRLRRDPDARVLILWRINLGLLQGAVSLIALRYLEAATLSKDVCLLGYCAIAPCYSCLLGAHIFANRDYFRPRSKSCEAVSR